MEGALHYGTICLADGSNTIHFSNSHQHAVEVNVCCTSTSSGSMPFQTNPQKLSHTFSQSPLRCQKVSLGLWPCHAFPSVAFLALRRLHWYRDLVWVFSQLGCLLEALWPCEFLIHPTAHHVCAGTAASSRPKTQQQALRAGLRRIACPISLSPSTGTSQLTHLSPYGLRRCRAQVRNFSIWSQIWITTDWLRRPAACFVALMRF